MEGNVRPEWKETEIIEVAIVEDCQPLSQPFPSRHLHHWQKCTKLVECIFTSEASLDLHSLEPHKEDDGLALSASLPVHFGWCIRKSFWHSLPGDRLRWWTCCIVLLSISYWLDKSIWKQIFFLSTINTQVSENVGQNKFRLRYLCNVAWLKALTTR